MKNITRTIACAAIATLAILPAATATGQQQNQAASAASMEARSERREATLELLIAAQQKCYDQAIADAQARRPNALSSTK